MSQFILLLRSETIDFSSYSAEDYQKLLNDFDKWNEKLEQKGLLVSAGLSGKNAKTLRQKKEQIISDGPYCDTKEAITGFCLITADNQEEAFTLASGCPFLPRGGSVEIMGINQLEINKEYKEENDDEASS